jgi:hypothetical protein
MGWALGWLLYRVHQQECRNSLIGKKDPFFLPPIGGGKGGFATERRGMAFACVGDGRNGVCRAKSGAFAA